MILIMVTAWIPPGKGAEAAEKYMEVMKKIPQASFEKPLVQAASTVTKHGISARGGGFSYIRRSTYSERNCSATIGTKERCQLKGQDSPLTLTFCPRSAFIEAFSLKFGEKSRVWPF